MASVHAIWRISPDLDLEAFEQAASAALGRYGTEKSFLHLDAHAVVGGNLEVFLPEDRFDQQPLRLAGSPSWMVSSVRLDNREELRRKLDLSPRDFVVLADSSVLGLAWQKWGEDCVSHLVGAFTFIVWSPETQTLIAVRDHTGERPLYFHRNPRFAAIASMPVGLLALPGVDQGIDEDTFIRAITLIKYPSSVSFFKGIERVPPGHRLRVTCDVHGALQYDVAAFWRPFETQIPTYKRDEDYAEAFLEIFDNAVGACLRTSGGVATQLSAGLDSSAVTASAALQLASQGSRLTAFTAVPRKGFLGKGFPGRLADEGPGAALVAAMYPNVDHVMIDSEGIDLVNTVKTLSDAACEPVQNSVNALWIAATLDAARKRGCTTFLVGFRGNLTFSHSGVEALGQMLRRGQLVRLGRTMQSFRSKGLMSFRTSGTYATTGILPPWLNRRLQGEHEFDLTYSPVNRQLAEDRNLRALVVDAFFSDRFDLQEARRLLFQIYDVDTYNAAYQAVNGVDVRDPYANRRVMEFCFGIPIEQYVVGGVPRSLARRSMANRLPQETLTRTVRGQQGADWYLTIKEALPALRKQIELIQRSSLAHRLLDLPRIQTLLDTWPEDTVESMHNTSAWCDALGRAFSFGYFLRQHETK